MMREKGVTYVCLAGMFAAFLLVLSGLYRYVLVFQYDTNDCFFLFSRAFFESFLDHPGWAVRYGGRFVGQFYHLPWLGALILSVGIASFGLLFHAILARCKKTDPPWQMLLPCVLLLALHTSTLFLPQDSLGLGLGSLAFLGYLSLPQRLTRRIYAILITPLVYFCAGGYVWLLVAWVVIHECLDPRRRSGLLFSLGYAPFSVLVPLAAWRWLYAIPLRSALTCPVMFGPPFRTGWADQSGALLAVDCVLAIGLVGTLLLLPFSDRIIPEKWFSRFRQENSGRWVRLSLAGAIALSAILFHLVRYDGRLALVVSCRQLCKARQWDALLSKARKNPYGDHRIQFMTNLALYHRGTLLDEMFRYPQPCGTRGLFMNYSGTRVASPQEDDTDDGMYNSDLLYEMGLVNFSLRHAFNCLTLRGETYPSVARMAECSIANGNLAMASKYLNLLRQTLFYRDFADRLLATLADPEAVDREFGSLRERLPTVDGFGRPTTLFLVLLESKPDNRMALEYLLAWLLLDKTPDSLESICADMGHLRDVGISTLPRHCQEAALLGTQMMRVPVESHGFRFDPAVVKRVQEFQADYSGRGVWLDSKTARSRYGDTYMFYWFFETGPSRNPSIAGPDGRPSATTREE